MPKRKAKIIRSKKRRTRIVSKTTDRAVKRNVGKDWIGIVSIIITVILGIILPILIPQITRDRRDLVYAINPIRTTIVSASACPPDLHITRGGIDLGCVDVTSAHVAIWNDGNLSIRSPENVLKDIVIFTEPEVEIIDASVRGYHNEETKFAITYDEALWKHGKILVSWKILQKKDGDSVQITYLGTPNVNIYVDGKIEKPGSLTRIDLGPDPNQGKTWKTLYESQKISGQVWLYSIIFAAVLTILIGISIWRHYINIRGGQRKITIFVPLGVLWFYIGLLYFLTPKFMHWPPFGF